MEIIINKVPMQVPTGHGEMSLLEFIRDVAGLKGTKFGCGAGLCGACTVHIDGNAERACQVSLDDISGRQITTIEGLAGTLPSDALHPVQQAWIETSVPQCGYCQAGQIMSAAALLAAIPDPNDAQIRREMNGNLCRCGTYSRIRQAIKLAAREINNV